MKPLGNEHQWHRKPSPRSGLVQQDGAANGSQPFSSQEESNVIGGWLPSLTFALGESKVSMLKLFKKPEYQVVIEFHGDDPENFDRVLALEAKLDEELKTGEVDGNDVGQGIVNIFIITKEPKPCFEEAMRIIAGSEIVPHAAGYRDLEGEDYVRLWPRGDETPFELK